MVSLADINQGIQKNKRKRRVGRGPGSGYGKTAARGHNGDGSRSGHRSRRGYEGGQMPLFRRVAKRGFSNNAFTVAFKAINLDQLQGRFDDGADVDIDALKTAFSLSRTTKVKVLGRGEITKKLNLQANAFSASAAEAIEKAGGSAVRV